MQTIFKLGVVFSVIDKITGATGRIRRLVGSVGDTAKRTGKFLGAMAIGAGLAMLPTVQTYANFEKTIAAVGAVSQATEGDLKRIENRAIQLGIETEHSSTAAAQGFLNLSKAGFTVDQQMKAIRPSLLLATAGNLELGAAASTTAVGIKAFNLGAGDAARVVDVLTSATQNSRLQADEFEQALGQLGPAATGAKQPFELMIAALGLMKDQGGTAIRRAEQLKTALVAVRAPTGSAAKEVNKLVRDAEGNLLKLPDLIDRVSGRIQGLSKAAQDQVVVKIFGREGLPVFDALRKAQFSVNGEIFRGTDALRAFDKANRAALGTGQKFADIFLKTFAGKLKLLTGSMETFGNVTGRLFADKLKPWVQALTTGLNVMIKWVRENPKAARGFADTAAQAALWAGGLAAVSLGLWSIMFVLKPFAALLSAAFLNPIGLTIVGVLALAVALAIVIRRWDDLTARLKPDPAGNFIQRGAHNILGAFGIQRNPAGKRQPTLEETTPGLQIFKDELGNMLGEVKGFLGQQIGFKASDTPAGPGGGGRDIKLFFTDAKFAIENGDKESLMKLFEEITEQYLPGDTPRLGTEK